VSVVTAFLLVVFQPAHGWRSLALVAMDAEKHNPGESLIRSARVSGVDPESPENAYVLTSAYRHLSRTVNL